MALLRSVATIGSYTLVSRVFGFIRDILTAAILGAGPVADAFFVAQRLPNLFRSLFAEGAFSAAFVPLASSAIAEGGKPAVREFAEEAFAVLFAASLVFVRARRDLHAGGHARRSPRALPPSRASSSSSSP